MRAAAMAAQPCLLSETVAGYPRPSPGDCWASPSAATEHTVMPLSALGEVTQGCCRQGDPALGAGCFFPLFIRLFRQALRCSLGGECGDDRIDGVV